jgi:N-formylglutamate amidohydrolase
LPDKPKRKTGGVSANPELDALRSAVGDQFPDAEIKARLARAHDAYLQRVAQLTQAQADLRAVLTVRQEAVAVMAGLLPP